MTRSVNKTKQHTVLLEEETLFGCLSDVTWCMLKWGGGAGWSGGEGWWSNKPGDNIIHGHSHSMDVSGVNEKKADKRDRWLHNGFKKLTHVNMHLYHDSSSYTTGIT